MPSGVLLGNNARISYRDAGNEPGALQLWGADVTAGNLVAQTALFTTLIGAADALVLGARSGQSYANDVNVVWDQPTNGASREIALLIQYRDATTGQRFTAKLPTLDPTIPEYVVNLNARDVILMDSPSEIADFVTAFNAFAINPYNGNACEVIGLKVSRGGK